mgnify:CR=1 FL=1
MPTPWRKLLYKELANIDLNGRVLDLGGSKKSGYHGLLKGEHTFDVANIDKEYGFDIELDLEQPFKIDNEMYDGVLAINVLEHIYNHENFLSESYRVMKQGGSIIIGVPFLIQVHPCPHDHWRYSKETLEKILDKAGFKDIQVRAVGRGPFTAAFQIIYNALFFSIFRAIVFGVASVLDSVVQRKMNKDSYPLGYLVTARK